MQVVNDRAAAQVKQVFAKAPIAGTTTLPSANVSQGMFDGHSLSQLGTPQGSQLPSA